MKKYLFSLLFALFLVFISNTSFSFLSNYEGSMTGGQRNYPEFTNSEHFFIFYSTGNPSSSPHLVSLPNDFDLSNIYAASNNLKTKLSVSCDRYKLNSDGTEWVYWDTRTYSSASNASFFSLQCLSYINFNLFDISGNILFEYVPDIVEPSFQNPYFDNKDKLQSLDFENMIVHLGDYDYHEKLYLHKLDVNQVVDIGENQQVYYYNDTVFLLDFYCPYYVPYSLLYEGEGTEVTKIETPDHYSIPKYKFEFEKNKNYYFVLSTSSSRVGPTVGLINGNGFYDFVSIFTGDDVSFEQTNQDINKNQNDKIDEQTNSINNQTNAIKHQTQAIEQQHETNKGIWGTIKEILSYINPFSENFFVYKLVELLVDGLKALFSLLFIPSNDFFANWFSDLNDTFKEQFGILYYPVSVVIEFLSSLDESLVDKEPIISTPTFILSFMNFSATLLPASSYNFNSLLTNDTFVKVHNFYLFFVNVIFTIGLIAFAGKVATEIFGGIDDSVDTAVYNSQADARAYNNYARQQQAKKTYQQNQRGR